MTLQPTDTAGTRTPVAMRSNRLHWFAGRTHEVLDDLGEVPTWSMSLRERAETVGELASLRSRIDARMAALVAEADRVNIAADAGATNTAAWLRGHAKLTGAEAAREVKRAVGLDRHATTMAALAAGTISTSQGTEIVTAVEALPAEVADQAAAGEAHLLGCAAEHDAKALRALGKHLVEVIAPDRADALIAAQLAREEAEAAKTAYLRTWTDGVSRYGRFKIPELPAACSTR